MQNKCLIKNNKKLFLLELIGLIVTVILSFVWHFMYDWTNSFAFLFPVNESVWEHIKILFYPYLLWTIIEAFFIKEDDILNYITIKSIALLIIPISMISMFYIYSGIYGSNVMIIDILIGILSLIIGFIVSFYMLCKKINVKGKFIFISLAVILLIMIVVFTYYPIMIGLFFDKTKGIYGIA